MKELKNVSKLVCFKFGGKLKKKKKTSLKVYLKEVDIQYTTNFVCEITKM